MCKFTVNPEKPALSSRRGGRGARFLCKFTYTLGARNLGFVSFENVCDARFVCKFTDKVHFSWPCELFSDSFGGYVVNFLCVFFQ